MNEYFEKWCCMVIFMNNNETDTVKDLQHKNQNTLIISKTIEMANSLPCAKHIYYSDAVSMNDNWQGKVKREIINGDNKAEQRKKAFELAFKEGFRKVILIENDVCPLELKHIQEAFNCLKLIEFCVGPKKYGGYYLLGMNYFESSLFDNIQLDSPLFVKEFIKEIGKTKKALYKLPVLDVQDIT